MLHALNVRSLLITHPEHTLTTLQILRAEPRGGAKAFIPGVDLVRFRVG